MLVPPHPAPQGWRPHLGEILDPPLQGLTPHPSAKSWIRHRCQWRIQDFPQGGALPPKIAIIFQIFAKNCMKMKEFGPRGRGRGRASLAPPYEVL